MPLQPRPELESISECPHGGINAAEMACAGIKPEKVIDFSVCTNPYMPPPGIKQVISAADFGQYPDSAAGGLRRKLSLRLGVAEDKILVGSGSMELIRLIALAYLSRGDRVLLLEPTFGEYRAACQIAGAGVIEQRAKEENGFALDTNETVKIIKRRQPRAVFVCNPNNPTGGYLSREEVEAIAGARPDTLVIMDEAYASLVDNGWQSTGLASRDNVVLLRSMTKDYGLAGLRLGYAVAAGEVIAALRKVCPPWNVNIVAQKVGAAVLEQDAYLEKTRQKLRRARRLLEAGLKRLGLSPLPSQANYFLVRVGDAAGFRAALMRQGMLVRDCRSFGLPEYVRIAPRTLADCRRLLGAIGALKRRGEI